MSILWSDTGLPNPTQRYAGEASTPTISTRMETGRVRRRRRFNRVNTTVQVSWVFTTAQFDTFKTFFSDTTSGGLVWFYMPLPGEDFEDGEVVLTKIRFAESGFGYQYRPHNHWQVSAELEKFVETGPDELSVDLSPIWFQPEVDLVSDIDAIPGTHRNALFKSSPGSGATKVITVPAVSEVEDYLPVGVMLTGAGSVIVRTEGEDGGGGGEDESLTDYWLTQAPWAVWTGESVVEDEGSIIQLSDLTGNGRNLLDSQTDTSKRALLNGVAIETVNADDRNFMGEFASGTFPSKCRIFMVIQATAAFPTSAPQWYLFTNSDGSVESRPYMNVVGDPTSLRFTSSNSGGNETTGGAAIGLDSFLVEYRYYAGVDSSFTINGLMQPNGSGKFNNGQTHTWPGLNIGGLNRTSTKYAPDALYHSIAVFDETTTELTLDRLLEFRRKIFEYYPTAGKIIYPSY